MLHTHAPAVEILTHRHCPATHQPNY